MPETFAGLALPSLQALLLYDRPGRAYSPELLLILQQMQGVLAIHRGDGASRFRIGLKDLGPAVEHDAALAPMLPRAWQRLVGTALDALEDLAQARAGGEAPPDTLPGWDLFDELATYLDAALALAGSEPLAARWRAARSLAEALQSAYDARLAEQALSYRRLRPLNLLLTWAVAGRGKPDRDNWFGGCLANRGIAHADTGNLAAAIADFDAAVALSQGIRDALLSSGGEAAWGLPLRNDLANVLLNRGNARYANGNPALAIADYDAALAIREGIRDTLLSSGGEAAWSLQLRNDLARVLQNRGNAHKDNGDLAAAIADYDAAVVIRDALCQERGEAPWNPALQNDLAAVLQNRGVAHRATGNLAAAIADYDAAVTLREGIRDILLPSGDAAWSLPLRNDLAKVLQNRGFAHQTNGDLAAAIADHDAAVAIGERIRDTLLSSGGEAAWSLPLRNLLTSGLQNRGNALAATGNLAAAIADYDAAVTIREGIRDTLLSSGGEAAWSLPLRIDLARTYCARALSLPPARGEADLNAAAEIAAGLRAVGPADLAARVNGFIKSVRASWAARQQEA